MNGSSLISESRAPAQAGFTLIEILIAITLLAFITFGVVQVTQNAVDTMERTTETNKNNLQIETAMNRFEWDFTQIYTPMFFSVPMPLSVYQDLNGDGLDDDTGKKIDPNAPVNQELVEYMQRLRTRFEQSDHFVGINKDGLPIPRFYSPEKNIFEFFTASNRRKLENTRQSHFAWVRYQLGEKVHSGAGHGTGGGQDKELKIPQGLKALVRYFYPDDPYSDKRIEPGDSDSVKASVLLENVESLEFQFWDNQRKKWENSLRSIQNGETIMRGVKILITWYDSEGIKRSAERIFRNSWPMMIPDDKKPATTTGAQGGGRSGGNTQGAASSSN